MHTLIKETIINRPLNEVFDFFCRAENLNRITPPDLYFKIITLQPIKIKQGTIIDYRIKLKHISFKWKTEITVFEPGIRFTDVQLQGPYKLWIHEHFFEEREGKTYMRDTIQFLSPGWILEPLIHKLFVNKKVKAIFDYREKALQEFFN